jgi:hypothetical protein
MATVRLGRYECENGHLPLVCMRCGAGAEEVVRHQFVWQPPWIFLGIFFGILPYLILAFTFEGRMTIQAPLCFEHRRHWANRKLFNYFMVFTIFCSFMFSFLLAGTNPLPRQLQDQVTGFLCLGVTLAALVWVIAGIVWDRMQIRPQHIDDQSITLKGVAPAFVAVVQAQT